MITLVAITDSSGPPPAAPLGAVRSGSLCALYQAASDDALSIDDLASRGALLDDLMAERDLLPVRYGTEVPDERAAASVLEERQAELRAALDRVRGAVELSVRVRATEDTEQAQPLATASGRDYLHVRVARSDLARSIHEALSPYAREATHSTGRDLLRAAYLVDRAGVPAFVGEVQRLQGEHPDLALLCTGPWPPFSFAEAGTAG